MSKNSAEDIARRSRWLWPAKQPTTAKPRAHSKVFQVVFRRIAVEKVRAPLYQVPVALPAALIHLIGPLSPSEEPGSAVPPLSFDELDRRRYV